MSKKNYSQIVNLYPQTCTVTKDQSTGRWVPYNENKELKVKLEYKSKKKNKKKEERTKKKRRKKYGK